MKRLIIVCEGQTEQSFCLNVLSPYYLSKNIFVEAPTIKQVSIVRLMDRTYRISMFE